MADVDPLERIASAVERIAERLEQLSDEDSGRILKITPIPH